MNLSYNRTAADEHKSVGANAFVTIAPGDGAGLWVGDGVLHDINIDIVVAATVHLGEWNLHRLRLIIFTAVGADPRVCPLCYNHDFVRCSGRHRGLPLRLDREEGIYFSGGLYSAGHRPYNQ